MKVEISDDRPRVRPRGDVNSERHDDLFRVIIKCVHFINCSILFIYFHFNYLIIHYLEGAW